ncbi:LytTR family transcriptional regulator [Mameliella alba]|nr:LytTR family transcriptional regulator [Antarctobacter heliothermus]MBY6145876.1 LytTR family transcriptional regulator [Mameliella alba]MCA0954707.1 LytTR family transcriptional regulator [Mameliella alba]
MTANPQQKLTFFDVLGGRFTLTPEELVALMRHRTTLTYLTVVYVLLLVTDSPRLWGAVPVPLVLILWLVIMVVFHAAVWVVVRTIKALQARFGERIWPGPVIVLCSLTPAVAAGQAIAYLGSGGTVWFQFIPDFLMYWIIAELFGLIYFRYVRAHVDGAAPPPAPAAQERSVVIGAEPVPLSRVRHIEAREHHVHVTLDNRSLTQRARLGDIIAQTGPDDGFQPHRSWWVSAASVANLVQVGAKHVLHLEDGTHVPVARSRLDEVRYWLDRHR